MMPARAVLPRRAAHGVTLIELAVVMAIIVTLATLALPYYGDYLARHRLKAAAEGLAVDLAEARQEAARRGTAMHVNFSAGADWCYAITTAPGCSCRMAATCRLKTVSSVNFAGIGLMDASELLFDPSGSTALSAARLQTAKGQSLVVKTSPLGRARVCTPVRSGPVRPCTSSDLVRTAP